MSYQVFTLSLSAGYTALVRFAPGLNRDRTAILVRRTASIRDWAALSAAAAALVLLGGAPWLAACGSPESAAAPTAIPPTSSAIASPSPTIARTSPPPTAGPATNELPTPAAAPAAVASPGPAPAPESPTAQPESGPRQPSKLARTTGQAQSLTREEGSAAEGNSGGAKPDGARLSKGDARPSPAPGTVYTWQDGDRTERALLQSDFVVQSSSENIDGDVVVRDDGVTSIVQKQPRGERVETQPVFYSQAGDLMTLPGGVLLALDPGWDAARVDRFFSDNGIGKSRVQDRDFAINAFFVTTEPGFPSLNLANELANQEGVVISSPNWRTEVSLR